MRAVKNATPFLTFCFIAFFAASAWPAARNAVVTETAPVFDEPLPGLLARGFLDKHDSCSVDSTHVDSAGAPWFHVRALRASGAAAKMAGGWISAKAILFVSDMPADFASQDARGDGDRKRRLEILKSHQQWPRRVIQAVRSGRICLDMSEEQVAASWGEPAEKRKAFMIGVGDYVTLVYRDAGSGKGTLVVALQNDRVIGWTTEE
jgi:hypothetical protein